LVEREKKAKGVDSRGELKELKGKNRFEVEKLDEGRKR
jgi:hypothetical protein